MTRRFPALAALAAALFLTAPATAAPRPWTAIATPVASGSYLIGNPKARVRLVEIVSYTCPHCAHFAAEAGPALSEMVRSGTLAIEVRNQIHDKIDLAAAALARCAGPAAFPALHEALYAKQGEWAPRAFEWDQTNAQRIGLYPELAQLRALADGAGLVDLARGAGVSDAAITQCFAGDAAVARTLGVSKTTEVASGTPSFMLNGKLIQNVTWAQLAPMLRAAGAK